MPTTKQPFANFIGQTAIINQIKIMLEASKIQNLPFGHTLLIGTAGVGKTTIAQNIADILATNFYFVQGTSINKISDVISLLTNLKPFDVIFLDEIHIINKEVLEILYTALEGQYLNIVVGKSYNNKIIRIDLPPFTLIAATNKVALLPKALLSRFMHVFQMHQYQSHEIKNLIQQTANQLNWELDRLVIDEIYLYCRNIPRNVINTMRQIYNYCLATKTIITKAKVSAIMHFLQIYRFGLNYFEVSYLQLFVNQQKQFFSLETISSLLNEEIKNIEVNYEPFLLQQGLIRKSSQGRTITDKGKRYLLTILDNFH